LVLDLLYYLMLKSARRLQKCRIYEMTGNAAARSIIAYLIVWGQAQENAFAKALESLGVNWGKVLPIPKTNAEQFPEVKKLLGKGYRASSASSATTTRVKHQLSPPVRMFSRIRRLVRYRLPIATFCGDRT
jgi:Mn-containing catalase